MKKNIIFFSLLLFTIYNTKGQGTAKIHSIFIYNFSKLIEWPTSYRTGNFEIAVLGNGAIYDELTSLAKVKKVANQTIVIRKINNLSELSNAHILYIPSSQSEKIENSKKTIGSKSTLLISDTKNGIKKGADINFIIQDNKPKFEIKPSNIKDKSLSVSTKLLKLGITK